MKKVVLKPRKACLWRIAPFRSNAKRCFADIAQIISGIKCGFVTVKASLSKMFPKAFKRSFAFSLVEMLMALLVASLLMAALAPVMTKRYGESVNVSGTGKNTSEHFKVFDDVTKNGTDDNKFTIPANATNVRVTMIGGGGGGGGATFGSKVITSTETNWKVPDGVNKIRVYMVAGGGGGASGGIVLANQLGTLKKGYYDYKDADPNTTPKDTGGEFKNQKISDLITTKTGSKYHPEIDSKCSASGYDAWESNITSLATTITGCGAGGAGGATSGGGSGAYTSASVSLPDNYTVRIPGVATQGGSLVSVPSGFSSGSGGTGGQYTVVVGNPCTYSVGAAGTYGGKGGQGVNQYNKINNCTGTIYGGGNGSGAAYSYGGLNSISNVRGGRGGYYGGGGGGGGGGCNGGGAGGGGPAIVMNSSNSVLFIASGGGGAGGYGFCITNRAVGSGGGGGGPYGGGGGGGSAYQSCHGTGGTGGGSKGAAYNGTNCAYCNASAGACHCGSSACYFLSGAGGGGWPNGAAGTITIFSTYGTGYSLGIGGKVTNVFDDTSSSTSKEYCHGGGISDNGKPGAIRISWEDTANALKCSYNTKSNGGSGGGGGEVWIGEISVTPGEYLNFHIGTGGAKQQNYSSNGNNGGNTYITRQSGAVIKSVAGGGGGVYTTSSTMSGLDMLGRGKGKNISDWYDWTGVYNDMPGGIDSDYGKTIAQGSGGGKGGGVYFKDGALTEGGNGGNSQANGIDAVNYGTGGGGGGGVKNDAAFPGYGGAGAPGYIYIEWGDSNGGGGSTGEIIEEKQIISLTAGTIVEVEVGEGGKGAETKYDSETKYKPGSKGENGKDTIIKINGKTYNAKGGAGGFGGGLTQGIHGAGGKLEDLPAGSTSFEGMAGMDNYGGIGGSAIYRYAASGEGIGGCGGNMITGKCSSPSDTPTGKAGAPAGSGGGGGSVKAYVPYGGGSGGNGLVIIEWEEFMK